MLLRIYFLFYVIRKKYHSYSIIITNYNILNINYIHAQYIIYLQ